MTEYTNCPEFKACLSQIRKTLQKSTFVYSYTLLACCIKGLTIWSDGRRLSHAMFFHLARRQTGHSVPVCFAKLTVVHWPSPLLSFSFNIIIIPGRGMKGLLGSQRKWLGWNLMVRPLSGVRFFFLPWWAHSSVACHRVLLPCKDVKLRNHEQ